MFLLIKRSERMNGSPAGLILLSCRREVSIIRLLRDIPPSQKVRVGVKEDLFSLTGAAD